MTAAFCGSSIRLLPQAGGAFARCLNDVVASTVPKSKSANCASEEPLQTCQRRSPSSSNHIPLSGAQADTRESKRLKQALGEMVVVHHVGSTAIPTILAKPILDLMPVVRDLSLLDASRSTVESLRYKWWGEYAISGRRYCPLTEPATDRRIMQLHCFLEDTPEVERHSAFRDYFKSIYPCSAHSYDLLKRRCRDLHPVDSYA